MWYKLLLILFALAAVTNIKAGKRPFDVELHSIQCRQYNSRLNKLSCEMTKVATSRYALDYKFNLNGDLDKSAEMQITVKVKFSNNNKIITFMDFKMKVCDILNEKISTLVIKEMLKELKRGSNIPLACPIKGDSDYGINNFTFSDSFFPPYTPNIYYNFTLDVFENNCLIADLFIAGSTIRRS
ncbi:uncharacterized protein [Musca autumnalis]|uniref:uncharacterized protein n=1 Tax=Musca autumnalis TaxID=221902 RepID=UPI003CF1A37B